jgi:flagellar basal-body rod protein FlgB
MGLFDNVQQLQTGMDYHLARHNLLTANIAHIDTPGWAPRDLARPVQTPGTSPFQRALNVALERTHERHIAVADNTVAPSRDGAERWTVTQDAGAASGLDGNRVSVDREAVKLAVNQLRYDAIAQMAGGQLSGLSWAANDGRGA